MMRHRAALFLSAGLLAAPLTAANAAVLEWACQGQLGEQQVIFNRDGLVVVDTKQKMGDIRKRRGEKLELPPGSPPYASYDVSRGDFEEPGPMEFTRHDDPKRKLVLTEKSTTRTSHKHRLICGRDEDEDTYRKIYSFQRESEPARDINMQCFWYQLSTRGGRKGCD
ncbi:MAG: hypothetical protein JO237_09920 [Pseudolabrys sp.]|nr:hypothetical protein [Pseudolabrys sp.]